MIYWREVSKFEKRLLTETLEKCKWNQSETARMLHLNRRTLLYKMESLGIKKPEKDISISLGNSVSMERGLGVS